MAHLALRDIEKKAWLRTFEHGLWDVALGTLFLTFGISILTHFAAMAALWIVVFMPGLREAGRKLVVPRIGHVKFRDRRSRANARLTGMLSVTAVLGLAVFLFIFWISSGSAPAWAQWIGEHFVVVIGLIWGGAMLLMAWLVDFPRLYGYGALMIVSLWITDLVPGYHLGLSLVVVGGIILLVGVAYLIRFLRKYPKQAGPTPESSDE